MNADTAQMVKDGERRLAERRVRIEPDLTVELVNRLTAERDALKREVRVLRHRLVLVREALQSKPNDLLREA